MHGDENPIKLVMRDARERVLEGLSTAFVGDELSIMEFETRIDAAFSKGSIEELFALLSDLSPNARSVANAGMISTRVTLPDSEFVEPAPSTGRVMAVERRIENTAIQRTVAIFGNVERRGRLDYPPKSQILSLFGNVEVDVREAVLSNPVTEMDVRAMFGNVEIVVGPKTPVRCEGIGIFGSFSGVRRVPCDAELSGPVLRITGSAIFGNVEVRTIPLGLSPTWSRRNGKRQPPRSAS